MSIRAASSDCLLISEQSSFRLREAAAVTCDPAKNFLQLLDFVYSTDQAWEYSFFAGEADHGYSLFASWFP